MSTITPESALLLLAMAAAAGTMGCFVVMRRMVLAADALSHVALPGIGLALLANFHPLAGAIAALLVGTLLIWGIERRSRLATETVIGVVFTASLAAGALLTSGDELVEALLGRPAELARWEVALAVLAALGVIAFLWLRRHAILVSLVSRDIATSIGIDQRWLDLEFLLAFAVTIALGLRYLGVLLMGSLVIIPGATAKRLAGNLRGMMATSVVVAIASTIAGMWIGLAADTPTGPPIVLVAAALFVLSLFRRPAM